MSSATEQRSIAVIGAGAVGSYYVARLAEAGDAKAPSTSDSIRIAGFSSTELGRMPDDVAPGIRYDMPLLSKIIEVLDFG